MAETLKLKLLGPPQISINNTPVAESTLGKAKAILYYLAVTGQPQSRSTLAGLLWSDMPEAAAKTNLRKALADLRKSVGDYLQIDRQSVAFKPDCDCWVDVVVFETGVGTAPSTSSVEQLQQAVDLYHGDFLTGFTVLNAPEFDAWVLAQQARLREMVIQTLHSLAAHYTGQRQFPQAIAYTRHLLALEPWREEAHRQLMLLLAQDGQRSAALTHYETCRQILADELDVEPERETVALYNQIRDEKLGKGAEGQGRKGDIVSSTPLHPCTPAPLHNLPTPPTPFIGREKSLAEIKQLLLEEPACRLLTLVGPGGIGKTRLSIEAASAVIDAFPHGVYFVSLASINDPQFIAPAIVEAMNINFPGQVDSTTHLLNYLHQKNLLLILDNMEHLLIPAAFPAAASAENGMTEGEALLVRLLSMAGQVKLLVTSRERLNLQEEWSYAVRGMPFPLALKPSSGDELQLVQNYSAVQLFTERARRAKANFSLSANDAPHVIHICQLVNGMPLGLELAASWVRTMTCQEIAHEVAHNLDFLTTSLRNVPARHRSLRAIIEQTWQRLPDAEKLVLSKFSVFQGGCLREAAEAVTGATLPLLSSLVDKALLRRTPTGRYDMHELIRKFAAEQLQTSSNHHEQTQDQHYAYYISFLQQRTEDLKGARQKEALTEIAADIDNVRTAWYRAIAQKDGQAIEKSVEALWLFSEDRGALHEGETAFRQAAAAFTADTTFEKEQADLIGFLLAAQGYLCARQGGLEKGRTLLEQGLLLLRQSEHRDKHKEAHSLMWLSFVFLAQGKYAEAEKSGRESVSLFSEIGDRWGMATCFSVLGRSTLLEGKLVEAKQLLQKCEIIYEEIGERRSRVYATKNLGIIAIALGEYGQIKQQLEAAVKISQEFNDPLGKAFTLRVLGKLAMAQGQYTQATQIMQDSWVIFNEIGSSWYADVTLNYLGSAYQLQGDYDKAEQLYNQSLKASKVVNHQFSIALCFSNLGCLAYDRQAYGQAEQYLQEALTIWQQVGNEPETASVLRHLGHVAAVMEKTGEQIKAYFSQALQLAATHGLAPIALDVFVGAAALLGRAGETGPAIELLALAEHHPAGTYETRKNAHRGLVELAAGLSSSVVEVDRTQSKVLDWRTAAHHVIDML